MAAPRLQLSAAPLLMVLLLVAAIATVPAMAGAPAGAAARPPLLAQWMQQRAARTAPTVGVASVPAESTAEAASYGHDHQAEYYEPVETVRACLTETRVANCKCIGNTDCSTDAPIWFGESVFTCCATDGYERDDSGFSRLLGGAEVGLCEGTVFNFETGVPVAGMPGVTKLGTYLLNCPVTRGSSCSGPFCDGMVLQSQGTIFFVEDVVSHTNPATPPLQDECDTLFSVAKRSVKGIPSRKGKAANKGNKGNAVGIAAAGPAAANYRDYSPDTSELFTGEAYIWSGPVQLTSLHKKLAFKEGFMQYAWFVSDGNTITASAAYDRVSIRPFTYEFELVKSEPSY